MTEANQAHTGDVTLPYTDARQYDVATFRDLNYGARRAELRELRL